METELKSLEDKVSQFVALCNRLRDDNLSLRQKLASALNDNQQLADKVSAARTRLEHVLARMPEGEA